MDDMKTKTVSELAELFGVTRQAMNKRVKSLDTKFVEKNEKNVTVVNAEGIHELEEMCIRDRKDPMELYCSLILSTCKSCTG